MSTDPLVSTYQMVLLFASLFGACIVITIVAALRAMIVPHRRRRRRRGATRVALPPPSKEATRGVIQTHQNIVSIG